MKRLLFTLLLALPAVGVFAQGTGQSRMPEFMDRGPIIDNINANAGSITKAGVAIGELTPMHDQNAGNNGSDAFETDVKGKEQSRQFTIDNLSGSTQDPAQAIATINRDMRFYPNPATTQLQIDLGKAYLVQITMVSVMGQEVFRFEGEARTLPIDVSQFPQGTYLLTIAMGKEMIVKRVQVVK